MKKVEMGSEVRIEPGEYFLADPCYVIKDEDWMGWLEECDYMNTNTLVGKIPGTDFFALGFGTAWGDGVYTLKKRGTYSDEEVGTLGVDAGLIGLVPVDYRPDLEEELYIKKVILTSHRDYVLCTNTGDGERNHTGRMTFGDYSVNTYDDEDDDTCPYCGLDEWDCECES